MELPKYNVYFNNDDMLNIGIYAVKRPNIPIPERNVDEKELKGRDGTVTTDYGTYKNISIDIEFNFIDIKDFYERVRIINKWLNQIKDNKLRVIDNPNYFYKVKYTRYKDIIREYKVKGSFVVSFICDPFQYSYFGQEEIVISNNTIIDNPSYILAKPIIKVWGIGIVTLYINSKPLIINLGQNITIDCELKEAFKIVNGNKEFINTTLTGKYPVLEEGENTISYTGNITKISIIPSWRIL